MTLTILLAFGIGVIVGELVGLALAALCQAASDADRRMEMEQGDE